MDINIGIAQKQLKPLHELLNALVADEVLLYQKTRNFHWNVVGKLFSDLHKLFEDQYEELAEVVDELAERVRQLGGHSVGTLAEFLKLTRLKEHPGHYPKAEEMIAHLLEDHETLIRQLRSDITACTDKHHDEGTADILMGVMEKHEKNAWMLRALLS